MKDIIKIEELAKFLFSYFISLYIGFAWWLFPVFLLAPDISMLGYIISKKTGAWIYNCIHHQALAIITGVGGLMIGSNEGIFAGLILFGHSSLDRSLGYGLKYKDDFRHTHLGWIGKTSHIQGI